MLQKRPAFDLLTDDPTLQTGLANDFQTAAAGWMTGWDSTDAAIGDANAGMADSINGDLAALDALGSIIADGMDAFDGLGDAWSSYDPTDALQNALNSESVLDSLLGEAAAAAAAPVLDAFGLTRVPGLPPSSGSIPPISGTGSGGSGGSGGGGGSNPPPPTPPTPQGNCPPGFLTNPNGTGTCVPKGPQPGAPPIIPPILGSGGAEGGGAAAVGTIITVLGTVITVGGAFLVFNWLYNSNWGAQFQQWVNYVTYWFETDPLAATLYFDVQGWQAMQAELKTFDGGNADRLLLEEHIAAQQAKVQQDILNCRAAGIPIPPSDYHA